MEYIALIIPFMVISVVVYGTYRLIKYEFFNATV
jgi:hypothetical protein